MPQKLQKSFLRTHAVFLIFGLFFVVGLIMFYNFYNVTAELKADLLKIRRIMPSDQSIGSSPGGIDDTLILEQNIQNIPLTGGTLFLNTGTYTITKNLQIPSYITLVISQGTQLKINTGVTLEILGPISAESYQIFAGDGKIIIGNLTHPVDASWWGANGYDSADDSNAISKAFASIAKGTVYIPGGEYYLSKGIKMDKDNISLVGAGMYKTKLNYRGDDDAAILVSGGNKRILHINISDLTVSGMKDSWNSYGKYGIYLKEVTQGVLERLYIEGFFRSGGTMKVGGEVGGTWGGHYDIAASGIGLYIQNSHSFSIRNNILYSNNIGTYFAVGNANTLERNLYGWNIKGINNYTVIVTNSTNVTLRENLFENIELSSSEESVGESDVLVYASLNTTLFGNYFEASDSQYFITASNLGGKYFSGGVNIENNYFTGNECRERLIHFENTQDSHITGNSFMNVTGADVMTLEPESTQNITVGSNYIYTVPEKRCSWWK